MYHSVHYLPSNKKTSYNNQKTFTFVNYDVINYDFRFECRYSGQIKDGDLISMTSIKIEKI